MRLSHVLCAAVLAGVPASPAAQTPWDSIDTPAGRCPVWESDRFRLRRFPEDASYSVCAVDRRPVPLEGNPMPPVARFPSFDGGELLVIVNPDGTVDSTRTGFLAWAFVPPLLFVVEPSAASFREAVERTVRTWRFRPGERRGEPVRVAVRLNARLEEKPYSGPTRPVWRYVQGAREDSLVVDWQPLPPLPPLGQAARDSVTLAAVRALADSGALRAGQRYCLTVEADSADPAPQAAAEAAAARVRALLASRGVATEAYPACYRADLEFLGVSRVFRPLEDVGVVWFDARLPDEPRPGGLRPEQHFPPPGSRHPPQPEWRARCHVELAWTGWTARCALDSRAMPDAPPPVAAASCPASPAVVTRFHSPGIFRRALEDFRREQEREREALEARRPRLSRAEYLEGISAYRSAIGAYREGIARSRRDCPHISNAILSLTARPAGPRPRDDVLVLMVTYYYTGDHGRNVSIGAITMLNGRSTGHWAYKPVLLAPGLHTARIELGMNRDGPDSYRSDAVDVDMYVHGSSVFEERRFRLERTWTRAR